MPWYKLQDPKNQTLLICFYTTFPTSSIKFSSICAPIKPVQHYPELPIAWATTSINFYAKGMLIAALSHKGLAITAAVQAIKFSHEIGLRDIILEGDSYERD